MIYQIKCLNILLINQLEAIYKILQLFQNYMIKASLNYHNLFDVYDYFEKNYGPLSTLVRQNYVQITFLKPSNAQKVLSRQKQHILNGRFITVLPFDHVQPVRSQQSIQNELGQSNSSMDIECQGTEPKKFNPINRSQMLTKYFNQKQKRIEQACESKIKQLKQIYKEDEALDKKIKQFETFVKTQIIYTRNNLLEPFKIITNNILQYSNNSKGKSPIQIQPEVLANGSLKLEQKKHILSPNYIEGLSYSNPQKGQIKRLLALNEQDFICTQQFPLSNDQKGQLIVYRKTQAVPLTKIKINEGPYSLLLMQNFILTGDGTGHIHFFDMKTSNDLQFSNRLSSGLIMEMLNFHPINNNSSILTLLRGRNDYKIKMFQVQKQNVSFGVDSLTFSPREEITCTRIVRTLQVIDDVRFVYGNQNKTFYCPYAFDLERQDYINHDQKVKRIKRLNEKAIVEATQRKIGITDLRTLKFDQYMFFTKFQLNTIEILSPNYFFYGGVNGQIGVVDVRRPDRPAWVPKQSNHSKKITDILLMGNNVITCDQSGIISEWTNTFI